MTTELTKRIERGDYNVLANKFIDEIKLLNESKMDEEIFIKIFIDIIATDHYEIEELIDVIKIVQKHYLINLNINNYLDNLMNIVRRRQLYFNINNYKSKNNKYSKKEEYRKRKKQFKKLKKIPQFEQRSEAWFKQREGMITASDIGSVLGLNKYSGVYDVILKKCDRGEPYQDNIFVHHGKKYEEIATLIYQYKYNIKVEEFRLIPHSTVDCIGASPDGICTKNRLDKKLSKLIGRMLEIKCPKRQVQLYGQIYGGICRKYYWAQVQTQLEVCDLDECDFWQCNISEYESRDEYIEDTDKQYEWISEQYNMERGCIIQLVPKDKLMLEDKQQIEFSSKYIYPSKIDLTIREYDEWIISKLSELHKTHPDCVFDRIIYWKLTKCKNVLIKRDREWFQQKLPIIEKTWK